MASTSNWRVHSIRSASAERTRRDDPPVVELVISGRLRSGRVDVIELDEDQLTDLMLEAARALQVLREIRARQQPA